MANRTFNKMMALGKEIVAVFFNATYTTLKAATGTLNLTNDIVLTKVATGSATNGFTFTLQVLAAAPNPAATVLVTFGGTASSMSCTVTPNDGTNNAATPVDLTTAELVELINTGLVAGKTITLTDAGALRNDQTATGGGATALADGGEGDGVVAIFAAGSDATFALTSSLGVSSLTQVSDGRYRITLDDAYYALKGIDVKSVSTSENTHTFQLRSEAVGSKTIDILLQSGDTNLGDQEQILGTLYLKNSSQP